MKILVTGAAGFIGFHLCVRLLENKNIKIYGLDNINSYYDIKLKKNRIKILKKKNKNFFFKKVDITEYIKLKNIFKKNEFDIVFHLAAQAGVRYSFENPKTYISNNINGFYNVISLAKDYSVRHFIFASSSSVYGNHHTGKLNENLRTDQHESLYAVTKSTNELIAKNFSINYNLKSTALRFFTVYGPYGRPDMGIYHFVDAIYKNKKIFLYNKGNNFRDFTYIDDVVTLVKKLVFNCRNNKNYDVFNIGYGSQTKTIDLIKIIENELNLKAKIQLLENQKGDVLKTHSDNKKIVKLTKFKPKNNITLGIKKFINWYLNYEE